MMSSRPGSTRTFFPTLRSSLMAGLAIAALFAGSQRLLAQSTDQAAPAQTAPAAQQPLAPVSAPGVQLPANKAEKKQQKADAKAAKKESKSKEEKVVQSKDTRLRNKKAKKTDPLAGQDAKLPDKVLYDKSLDATKHGHFDVARLDLQTLLNTYPDSQYQMRAKLAIADSWYKEGGTAALTQAETEYKDFITFFPNAPEAAEAQMRVGDIYFREMDKPDRDYAKTVHAEEEYRTMLQQFPDSVLVPDAKQRLREVQEVLGTREASIAAFYATHNNWAATIARYQTVADTYPQYSHMDDVLIGLGDAYSAEGRFVRNMKLPEAAKARLEKLYDDQAAAAYTKVATVYAASPHVEDARDRLEAMGQPIPKPTAEQLAASEQLENSRAQYRLTDRARLLILHQPDVVTAARVGEPTLADPKPTIAPDVTRKSQAEFMAALNPNAKPAAAATTSAPSSDAGSAPAEAAPASTAPAAPLALSDVGTGDTGSTGSTSSVVTAATSTNSGSGASAGIEIVSPGSQRWPQGSRPDEQHPAARDREAGSRPRPGERPRRPHRSARRRATRQGQESQARLRQGRRVLEQAQEEEGSEQDQPLLTSPATRTKWRIANRRSSILCLHTTSAKPVERTCVLPDGPATRGAATS
jgi:outer membrane protein assembly factor BamD